MHIYTGDGASEHSFVPETATGAAGRPTAVDAAGSLLSPPPGPAAVTRIWNRPPPED